jgi:hypothetical protein
MAYKDGEVDWWSKGCRACRRFGYWRCIVTQMTWYGKWEWSAELQLAITGALLPVTQKWLTILDTLFSIKHICICYPKFKFKYLWLSRHKKKSKE